ncbi:glycosyltransferase [Kutzneria sp. CA-103260]|uniref:glycosyltransferase n=1 Tax=Kutzneria sp. CA-103260 TaxID=2802641 RepID=UPI001BA9F78B|nr:glycosyltransferase family 2 protein [Kutzneria sp. CA-103260]QUQ65517.1 Glycosyl transferase family group 2 [Kutzneria sp. CA-103260]
MAIPGGDASRFYPSAGFFLALAVFAGVVAIQLSLVRDLADAVVCAVLVLPVFDTSLFLFLRLRVLTAPLADRSAGAPTPVTLPKITFVLPSYREPFDVKTMTLDSVLAVRYPGPVEIISVDNSPDPDTADQRRWRDHVAARGVVFLHNGDPAASKPGNLDLALSRATGEFVVFVDVDSTLPADPGWLFTALRDFAAEPGLGYVQFHVVPTNGHFNQLTEGTARYLHLHNAVEVVAGQGGFAMFKGHNAIWRRTALDAIGSWREQLDGRIILAEDFVKALHAYRLGYHGRISWLATGEWIPSSLAAFTSMWQRWIYGTIQAVAKQRPSALLRSPEFGPFDKIEILRRVKFGTFVVPYLAFVAAALFPSAVLIPYLLLFAGTLLAGLVAGARVDASFGRRSRGGTPLRTHAVAAMAELYVNMIGCFTQLRYIGHRLRRRAPGASWTLTHKGTQRRLGFTDALRRNGAVYASQGALAAIAAVLLITDSTGPVVVFLRAAALLHFVAILLMPACLGRTTRAEDNHAGDATIDPRLELTDVA